MTHVLVLSLGTSPEPIVNCITNLQPDRVVFLCSEGSRSLVDAVLQQVALPSFDPDRDVVVLDQRQSRRQGAEISNELDQLDRVYSRATDLLQQVHRQHPGCALSVDYTGGTKTMTTGLAMAAIDDGRAQLQLTTKEMRPPGQQALSGYSAPVPVCTAAIQARRLQELELPQLLERFDYAAARRAVSRVRRLPGQDSANTSVLWRLEQLLVAFDAWDRFDHRKALEVLEGLGDRQLIPLYVLPLKKVVGSRCLLDRQVKEEGWPSMRGHGLEAVEDLLRNAERRAAQERFDDAVGRLYRATELTAQILLKEGVKDLVGPAGIDTGDVAIDQLPADLEGTYRKKQQRSEDPRLKLGLTDAYDLLASLKHPVGMRWSEQRSLLVDRLKTRNHSLFAHGFRSINTADWNSLGGTFGAFLQEAISAAILENGGEPLAQLPSRLQLLLPSA